MNHPYFETNFSATTFSTNPNAMFHLTSDDLLDTYRSNIDSFVESMASDFKSEKLAKVLFDISGTCENVEAPSIYKYFLTKVEEKIGLETLIKTLYFSFAPDFQMLKAVIHFNSALVGDKSLRMTSKQLSPFIYQIIDASLDYLSMVLEKAKEESWTDVLNELLGFVNTLFEATYVNLFLIKRKCRDKLIAFLYSLIDNLIVTHQWAQPYPELSKTMCDTFRLFFTNCSEVILAWTWDDKPNGQKQFFMAKFIELIRCVMNFCSRTLQEAAQSGKNYQMSEKLLETISKLYSFMRYKRNSEHRPKLLENIEIVLTGNQHSSVQFLWSLYKISMSNVKNIAAVLNTVCICIMELSYFYPGVYKEIFDSLGIPPGQIEKIKRIYENIKGFKEDPFFFSNLKEWLSKSENHYEAEIDY